MPIKQSGCLSGMVQPSNTDNLVALDEPEDRALIGASFAAGNRYFALEVGLRGEFGGDTEVVSGGHRCGLISNLHQSGKHAGH